MKSLALPNRGGKFDDDAHAQNYQALEEAISQLRARPSYFTYIVPNIASHTPTKIAMPVPGHILWAYAKDAAATGTYLVKVGGTTVVSVAAGTGRADAVDAADGAYLTTDVVTIAVGATGGGTGSASVTFAFVED